MVSKKRKKSTQKTIESTTRYEMMQRNHFVLSRCKLARYEDNLMEWVIVPRAVATSTPMRSGSLETEYVLQVKLVPDSDDIDSIVVSLTTTFPLRFAFPALFFSFPSAPLFFFSVRAFPLRFRTLLPSFLFRFLSFPSRFRFSFLPSRCLSLFVFLPPFSPLSRFLQRVCCFSFLFRTHR